MSEYKSVTFLRPINNYNAGDSAKFPAQRADAMIKAKIAKAYDAPVDKSKKDNKKWPESSQQGNAS